MSPPSVFGPRREPQPGGIRVVHVDPRDARRHRDGDLVSRRRDRAGGDAVLERRADRRQREAERARGAARHLGRAPAIAVGNLHLRDHRRAIADQPRFNRQRAFRLSLCAFPGVTSRPTRSGNSVSDAASNACRAGPREANSTSASATAAAAACRPARRSDRAGDDRVDVDRRRAPRRVGDHQLGQAPAGLGAGATSTAVTSRSSSDEARSSMIPRDLVVGRHLAQRREAPRQHARCPSDRDRQPRSSARPASRWSTATRAAPRPRPAPQSPRPGRSARNATSARHRVRTVSSSARTNSKFLIR